MAGFSDLLQILISCSVDLLGNGAVHGGKGMMMAGAKRIGWAGGGSSRGGRRFGGHRIAQRSLGGGFGGCGRGNLHNYDPKQAYLSTLPGASKRKKSAPAHLFGRPTMQTPDGPLGRYGSKWCKGSAYSPAGHSRRPRGNI